MLNTGHTRNLARGEAGNDVIQAILPLLLTGEHPIPGLEGYSCVVTTEDDSMLVTVFRGHVPLATFGIAPTERAADVLWPQLERQYLKLSDLQNVPKLATPARPVPAPWCAAIILLGLEQEAHRITDFEQLMAWAWVEACESNRPAQE